MIEAFFNPKSVAIIGATPKEGKVGRVLIENFIKRFKGKIYPVNPSYDEIMGLKCYKSVKDIQDEIDLAVIAIPAPIIPSVLRELGEKNVKNVIIIS
ncbi:MAG: CoA-binding protein [Desulfurococcaceae archaeon]